MKNSIIKCKVCDLGKAQINLLRNELHKSILLRGTLHEETISISQELDKLIVKEIRRQKSGNKSNF